MTRNDLEDLVRHKDEDVVDIFVDKLHKKINETKTCPNGMDGETVEKLKSLAEVAPHIAELGNMYNSTKKGVRTFVVGCIVLGAIASLLTGIYIHITSFFK